jgi:hypothetical protein
LSETPLLVNVSSLILTQYGFLSHNAPPFSLEKNHQGHPPLPREAFKGLYLLYPVGNDFHCQADLHTYCRGKTAVKRTGITHVQYCHTINFGKEKKRYFLCPVAHSKFTKKWGCNVFNRLNPSIRERIDYGSSFTASS